VITQWRLPRAKFWQANSKCRASITHLNHPDLLTCCFPSLNSLGGNDDKPNTVNRRYFEDMQIDTRPNDPGMRQMQRFRSSPAPLLLTICISSLSHPNSIAEASSANRLVRDDHVLSQVAGQNPNNDKGMNEALFTMDMVEFSADEPAAMKFDMSSFRWEPQQEEDDAEAALEQVEHHPKYEQMVDAIPDESTKTGRKTTTSMMNLDSSEAQA